MPRLKIHQVLFASFAVLLLVVNIKVYQAQVELAPQAKSQIKLIEPAPVPVQVGQFDQMVLDQITAQAYLAIDLDSAAPLIAQNHQQKLYPASTVKLMTALVARDVFHPDLVLMVNPELEIEGHLIGLEMGEKQTVANLIKAILINSGNDAAQVLARHHPQGLAGFVKDMNHKAQELSLDNTTYVNPSGLDHPAQLTTARDLTILAKEVIKDPFLKELVATPQLQITDLTGGVSRELVNTNQLLAQRPDVFGIKTGTTELAKQVLVTLVKKDGHQVVLVVMGSEDRYLDSNLLIDQVFNNYQWKKVPVN